MTPTPSDPNATPGAGGIVGGKTVRGFVEDLASAAPAPGGGAAAAITGATAAGLLAMVGEFSQNRPRYQQYAPTIRRAIRVGKRAGAELLRLADEDARVYAAFMEAWRTSRDLPLHDRRLARSDAARVAVEPPLRMLAECLAVARAAERLAGRSNPNLAPELAAASRTVEAAAYCAAENVYVNLPHVMDRATASDLREEARQMVFKVEREARAVRRTIAKGTPMPPEQRQYLAGDEDAAADGPADADTADTGAEA